MLTEELEIFDCHTHVLAPSTQTGHAGLERAHGAQESSLARLTKEWETCSIGGGILTQPSFFRSDNSVLLDALRSIRLPKRSRKHRLAGVVTFDWKVVSFRDMKLWDEQGVLGVRLNYFRGQLDDIPDLRSVPAVKVLTWIRQLDWHVNIYAEAGEIPNILATLRKARVKIVLNHFGMPHFKTEANRTGFCKMLEFARCTLEYPVFVTLSGDFRFSSDPEFVTARAQQLLAAFGEERVIWASDFPFTRYEHLGLSVQLQYRKLFAWVPSEKVRRKILTSNPGRLFPDVKESSL